ncbi:BrnA antitoxin of type II toxin-antitoxin system [Granulicella rosea]|uniref:BrnA antitoxin of type II toxin-antitoxin system n=1 Tax=Granulicella rosea TaxID=474952 RepID=A0A239LM27_9BACT|nr:BrnA antitoxin of type II toxin-antitoxin system [Granulicella rosea]
MKEAVSLRLDADVLAWLKKDGAGYQTRANQMLREVMLKDLEGK